MILTDDFVFIHLPKTGGSFVKDMLTRVYWGHNIFIRRLINRILSQFKERAFRGLRFYEEQHNCCQDIPESHRDKIIVAAVRNPYDRYVSQYKFEGWKRWAIEKKRGALASNMLEVQALYPHFPDITFEEFVALSNRFRMAEWQNSNVVPEEALGIHTKQFIRFFFKEPETVFPMIDREYIEQERYKADMYNIHFLHTERLNRELYDFLAGIGLPEKSIDFILHTGKICPKHGSRQAEDAWEQFYTPELKQQIRHRERFLFRMFPEYDV